MEAVSRRKVRFLKEISDMLKETFYGQKLYIGDLSPKNDNVRYGIKVNGKKIYFNTKAQVKKYIKDNNIETSYFKIEYVGECASYDNVVRITQDDNTDMYSVIDENAYFKYNRDKSFQRERPVWEFRYGNILDYYDALDIDTEKRMIR